MINYKNIIPFLFQKLLSDRTRTTTEKIILNIALLSFFVHLLIIYLLKFNVILRFLLFLFMRYIY